MEYCDRKHTAEGQALHASKRKKYMQFITYPLMQFKTANATVTMAEPTLPCLKSKQSTSYGGTCTVNPDTTTFEP